MLKGENRRIRGHKSSTIISLALHPTRPVSGKSPHIRRFLNDFVGGLARSMSRARFDANEVRLGADLCCLERGDIFEGVSRYHAIVRVGCGGEDRGIGLAGLDVVIRRVFEKVTEIREH